MRVAYHLPDAAGKAFVPATRVTSKIALSSDVFEEFSKPLEYLIDGPAARVAAGMDATPNVAMRADPVARLARRRLVMNVMV